MSVHLCLGSYGWWYRALSSLAQSVALATTLTYWERLWHSVKIYARNTGNSDTRYYERLKNGINFLGETPCDGSDNCLSTEHKNRRNICWRLFRIQMAPPGRVVNFFYGVRHESVVANLSVTWLAVGQVSLCTWRIEIGIGTPEYFFLEKGMTISCDISYFR